MYYNKKYLTKVNKNEARKLYNMGRTIILFPCNLDIDKEDSSNIAVEEIDKSNDGFSYSKGIMISFDSQVEEYEKYNCNNQTGRYCAYYVTNSN